MELQADRTQGRLTAEKQRGHAPTLTDLTNQATLKSWPIMVTVADLCWGTFLMAVAATAGFLITRALTSAS